MPKVKRYLPR